MFIIDFDDTIYNTYALKLDTLENLGRLGVPENLYWETYRQTRNNSDGSIPYRPESHAVILESHGFNYEKILNTLKMTLWADPKKYLFPDTISFLNFLKNTDRPLVLLSLGEPVAQEAKVKKSGVHDYFDRVFIIDSGKTKVLKELFSVAREDHAWFFNDKVEESLEIANEFPNLKIILRKSGSIPEEDYKKSGLPYFKTLTEIAEYVKQSI